MSEIVNTALRLYGFVEQQRERAKREIEFAHRLRGMEHQEKKWQMESLELEWQRENWDDIREAKSKELQNKIGQEEYRRVATFAQWGKTMDELADTHGNDPDFVRWRQNETNRYHGEIFGTTSEALSFVTTDKANDEQKREYWARFNNSLEMNTDLTNTDKQLIREFVSDSAKVDAGREAEVASWNLDPGQVAQAIGKTLWQDIDYDVKEDEPVELTDAQRQRVQALEQAAQQHFEQQADDRGSSREKMIRAIQQALTDGVDESEDENTRIALSHGVVAGMQSYVSQARTIAIAKHDANRAEKLGNAGMELADRIAAVANLSPEDLLNRLDYHNQHQADRWILDNANSGKTLGEAREAIEAQLGGSIAQMAATGQIDPSTNEFKVRVQHAVLDSIVQRAAVDPGADAVSLHAAAQKMRERIGNDNPITDGDGALEVALTIATDRIQKAVPQVQQRHELFAKRQREIASALRAHDGSVALGRPGSSISVVLPEAGNSTGELAQRLEQGAYTFARDTKYPFPLSVESMFTSETRNVPMEESELKHKAEIMANSLQAYYANENPADVGWIRKRMSAFPKVGDQQRKPREDGLETVPAHRALRLRQVFKAIGEQGYDTDSNRARREFNNAFSGLPDGNREAAFNAIGRMRAAAEQAAGVFASGDAMDAQQIEWTHGLLDLYAAIDADFSAYGQQPGQIRLIKPEL